MKPALHTMWHFTYNGPPVSLWNRIRIWLYLRKCEHIIKKEMGSLGYKKL